MWTIKVYGQTPRASLDVCHESHIPWELPSLPQAKPLPPCVLNISLVLPGARNISQCGFPFNSTPKATLWMMGNGNVCAEGLIGGLGIILLLTSFAHALTKCKYPNSSVAKTQS